MAVANSLAAVEGGALQVEGTINGIGERAGNAALEEVAVALHIRKDFYEAESSMILKEIKATSTLVSRLTGMVVPKNKDISNTLLCIIYSARFRIAGRRTTDHGLVPALPLHAL